MESTITSTRSACAGIRRFCFSCNIWLCGNQICCEPWVITRWNDGSMFALYCHVHTAKPKISYLGYQSSNLRGKGSFSRWFHPRTFVVILKLQLLPEDSRTNTVIHSTVLCLIHSNATPRDNWNTTPFNY